MSTNDSHASDGCSTTATSTRQSVVVVVHLGERSLVRRFRHCSHARQPRRRKRRKPTAPKQIKAIDPRSLFVFLVVLDEDVQAANVLETDESEIESVPFDVLG